ncbi:ATPase family associated with various cellular activities (AAA) [Filimonas lacunae]|uniref:ATPase family associated with various cellular activities (AAA) n=1 Tax=Filimonas lacunae TaxID=477680 RepID=A0A173MG77_9BACT|nr:AAA family ATPase [Filimonas lacunae]BAV06603.1 ATPase, AAA family [Filimonas lacunae]SIT27547.1 ATPase family associated with various cellular activities (AAA) [Filimonas lacunae]
MIQEQTSWIEANQQYLMANVQCIREQIQVFQNGTDSNKQGLLQAQETVAHARAKLTAPAPIDVLTESLMLSHFEREVILLCAGVELDSQFAGIIANVQGTPGYYLPTFGTALAALPHAHWSGLSPDSALRYWRLIEVGNEQLITKSALRLDEHILHYLTGVKLLDARLLGLVSPLTCKAPLVASHQHIADQMLHICTGTTAGNALPLLLVKGDNETDKEQLCAYVAASLGFALYSISVHAIPGTLKEMQDLVRIWNREAAICQYALYVDYTGLDTNDKHKMQIMHHFLDSLPGFVIVGCSHTAPRIKRQMVSFEIEKPTANEQYHLWLQQLGEGGIRLNGQLHAITAQFDLSAATIRAAGATTTQHLETDTTGYIEADAMAGLLWKNCCVHTRPQVDELAQRITAKASWDDLVLPPSQKEMLWEMTLQVHQRNKVYNEWGFGAKSSRGLGICGLFAGESGTGKTMAAEVLANTLKLDLYRIDLSQVVNKYIGETEKNLKRIFDAAEEGGAILLFDEADALFGKRSDVKDSHDRYANMEVSYLLQRMEAYRGLAILTTNLKTSMDKAWIRRIRFIIQFPFPDFVQRAAIWRRVFPEETPLQDIDTERLAKLNIAGGNIRNIALNAAFVAAGEGCAVNMKHIMQAARSEYAKLEKAFTNI